MADLVAIAGRCVPRMSEPPPGSGRRAEPVDHAVDEIAAAMTWTQHRRRRPVRFGRTARRVVAARSTRRCWPAQSTGPRPSCSPTASPGWTRQSPRTVTGRLLPDAAERTTGQLRARLSKLVIQADPDAARRRYRHGLKGRRVEHGREDDGTARLAGRWLPAARAAAANSRIQAIADWIKDGGDTRTVDQIRADVLLDLLQGPPVPGPDGQPRHHRARRPRPPRRRGPPRPRDQRRPRTATTATKATRAARATAARATRRWRRGRRRLPTRAAGPARAGPRPGAGAGSRRPGGRRPGLHRPDLARSRRPATRRARPTRPRPHPSSRPRTRRDAGTPRAATTNVGETADADTDGRAGPPRTGRPGRIRGWPGRIEGRPAAGRAPRRLPQVWAVQTHPRPGTHRPGHHPARPGRAPRRARLLGPGHRRNHPGPGRRPHQRPVAHLADRRPRPVVWNGPVRTRPDPGERRRFATATQAAHVRARDRRCRFPSCRRPAARAELDHTIPHTHDGPTHECNLCCLCVRHHILKTAGLWTPGQQHNGTHHLALSPRPHLPHRTRTRRGTRS